MVARYCWDNDDIDNKYYTLGNCYKTKEEAEKAIDIQIIHTELKIYAEEHNEHELDWNNGSMDKYYIYYDYVDKKIDTDWDYNVKLPNQIYFSSIEIAKEAIKEIGEDRVELWTKGE